MDNPTAHQVAQFIGKRVDVEYELLATTHRLQDVVVLAVDIKGELWRVGLVSSEQALQVLHIADITSITRRAITVDVHMHMPSTRGDR